MPAHRVSDMDFDEVSTVDIPANQHGLIVLAKRATTEEITVPQDNDFEIDLSQYEPGTILEDQDGNQFQVVEGDNDDFDITFDGADERELEAVGKSIFLDDLAKSGDDTFYALSKALESAVDDEHERGMIAKAFADQQVELRKAQAVAAQAFELAKAATDREEESRYIAKAAEYNVGIDPNVLGPVLKRMSDSMSAADCLVIKGVLENGTDIFAQYGIDGGDDIDDPITQLEKHFEAAGHDIVKSEDGRTLSPEQALVKSFDFNPREYSRLRGTSRRDG
jgi:hypothetical protein